MIFTVEQLADIEAIRQLKARYFRLMDQKRWDELKQVFTTDLEVSTPDDLGEAEVADNVLRNHPDVEVRTPDNAGGDAMITGNDAFVDMVASILGEVVTVHHGHTSEIAVDGDEGSGIWLMEDHLWWPPQYGLGHMWGSGWYEDAYRRGEDGEWRIASMCLRRIRIQSDSGQLFPKTEAY